MSTHNLGFGEEKNIYLKTLSLSVIVAKIFNNTIDHSLAEHSMLCLSKQCSSRSVGF